MKRLRLMGLTAALTAAALALMGAQRPAVFAQLAPGLWEFSGLPGAKIPLRQCVADVSSFAQFEHRGLSCSRDVITDNPGSAVVEYSCGGAGFGHSRLEVVTPRSLRIDTQGVSNKLPFSYVVQARRLGDCSATTPAPRH